MKKTAEMNNFLEEDDINAHLNFKQIEDLNATIENLHEQLKQKDQALEQWKQICSELSNNLLQMQIEFKLIEAEPKETIQFSKKEQIFIGNNKDEFDYRIEEEGRKTFNTDLDTEWKLASNSIENKNNQILKSEQKLQLKQICVSEQNTSCSQYASLNQVSNSSPYGQSKNESNKIEGSFLFIKEDSFGKISENLKNNEKEEIFLIFEERLKRADEIRNKIELEITILKWTNQGLEDENKLLKGKIEVLASEIKQLKSQSQESNEMIAIKQEKQNLITEIEKMDQQVSHLNAIVKFQSGYRIKYEELKGDYDLLTQYIENLRDECMISMERKQKDHKKFVHENQLQLVIVQLQQKLKIQEDIHREEIIQFQEKTNVLMFQIEKFKNTCLS